MTKRENAASFVEVARGVGIGAAALGGVLLGAALGVALVPTRTHKLCAQPDPATNYAEAMERFAVLQSEDGPDVNEVCRTQVLSHGRRVERAIVLFHGFTSCPYQFLELGQQLHSLGYNVLLPRMPHHGFHDRLGTALAQLQAEELVRFVDQCIDIISGLGEHTTVAGLSAGGVLTTWAAQFRNVDYAVPFSPAFAPGGVSIQAAQATMNAALRLPNRFGWWDENIRDQGNGPMDSYGYARHSTRAFGHIMRIGAVALRSATTLPPRARRVAIVWNAADQQINNAFVEQLIGAWSARQPEMHVYQFPAEMALIHDFIDPRQAAQQIDVVYPRLIDVLTR